MAIVVPGVGEVSLNKISLRIVSLLMIGWPTFRSFLVIRMHIAQTNIKPSRISRKVTLFLNNLLIFSKEIVSHHNPTRVIETCYFFYQTLGSFQQLNQVFPYEDAFCDKSLKHELRSI